MSHRRYAIAAGVALVASALVPIASSAAGAATAPPAAAPAVVTAPAAVTGLQVATSSAGEQLRWRNPSSSKLTGVVIRRSPGRIAPASPSAGTEVATLDTKTTAILDSTVDSHAIYSYAVFAMYGTTKHAAPGVAQAKTATSLVEPSSRGTGSFTGTVTDSNGHPLTAVDVIVTPSPAVVTNQGIDSSFIRQFRNYRARTGPDGTFTVNHIATDSYQVCFLTSALTVHGGDNDTLGYTDNCPQDSVEGHDAETTSLGTTMLANNPGGVITGKLLASDSGLPLAGVQVEPLTQAPNSNLDFTATNAKGGYRLQVPVGTYQLCFDAEFVTTGTGYVSTCTDTEAVVVNAGNIVTVNEDLDPGAELTGFVKSAVDGSPVGGSGINADQLSGSFAFAVTNSNGQYTMFGLDSSRTHICAQGFFTAPNAGSPEGFVSGCEIVHPKVGKAITAPDLVLAPAAGITGKVTTTDGHPLAGATVEVDGRNSGVQTLTGPNGTYNAPWLTPGTYVVCFYAASYPTQCWQNRSAGQHPTRVTLTAAQVLPGIDATIDGAAPGSVRATATDSGGHPLVGADLVLVTHCADPGKCLNPPIAIRPLTGLVAAGLADGSGGYTFTDIAPGHYALCAFGRYAVGGSSTTRYQDGCNDSSYSITVKSGATADASISLADGAEVTGTVTDSHGRPLAGVSVLPATGDTVDGTDFALPITTAADGTYVLEGIPAGTTQVCFDASGLSGPSPTGYASECYDHSLRAPTPITVSNGAVTSGIDAHLRTGAVIEGTVTDASNGPVANVGVMIEGQVGAYFANTGPDGTYRAFGLAPGTYFVCFDASQVSAGPPTGYVNQCYLNAGEFDQLTPVVVKPGQTASGIDASLVAGAEFTGQITSGGSPAQFVDVLLFIHTAAGGSGMGEGTPDGSYDFKGVPAGKYVLCADGSSAGYGSLCYDNVPWKGGGHLLPAGTTKLVATPGAVITTDMDLPAAG